MKIIVEGEDGTEFRFEGEEAKDVARALISIWEKHEEKEKDLNVAFERLMNVLQGHDGSVPCLPENKKT